MLVSVEMMASAYEECGIAWLGTWLLTNQRPLWNSVW